MNYLDYGNPTTEDHNNCIKCEALTINGQDLCECCKEEEKADLNI